MSIKLKSINIYCFGGHFMQPKSTAKAMGWLSKNFEIQVSTLSGHELRLRKYAATR
jgi:hypothetical protein